MFSIEIAIVVTTAHIPFENDQSSLFKEVLNVAVKNHEIKLGHQIAASAAT